MDYLDFVRWAGDTGRLKFDRSATAFAALSIEDTGLHIASERRSVVLPPRGGIPDDALAALRSFGEVSLPNPRDPLEEHLVAQAVTALSLLGVPLTGQPASWFGRGVDPAVSSLIRRAHEAGMRTEISREQYSIRLHRAAVRGQAPGRRPISVLLCTHRFDRVGHALRQVVRQRETEIQLVLGLHGVRADHDVIRKATGDFAGDLAVLELDAAIPLGEALNRMAAAASGEYVAKMDDDDWYGPDHLWDLQDSIRYSGAQIVGSAPEFGYLAELDATIRMRTESEVPGKRIMGGTLLLPREVLRDVGGFASLPQAGEDTRLIADIREAGGGSYQQHGLNYMYRRDEPARHTWKRPTRAFLETDHERWDGLVFNELMEL